MGTQAYFWLRHRRTGTFWPASVRWSHDRDGIDELRIPYLSYAAADHKRMTLLYPGAWEIMETKRES